MTFLTDNELHELANRAIEANWVKVVNPLILAVDFDHLIIHAPGYTWTEWCNTGQRMYPTAQPVRADFVDSHPLHFTDFVDMRQHTSIYAK